MAIQSTSSTALEIVGWAPEESGPRRGFVWVRLPSGLVVRNIAVIECDGRPRVILPRTPNAIAFDDIGLRRRFDEAVLEALVAAFPDALDRGEEP